MSDNNLKYTLFKEMLDGYKQNQEGLFESSVTGLMSLDPENPYEVDTPEYKLFHRINRFYKTWNAGGAGSKVSRVRMLNKAKEFCELVNDNPYVLAEEQPKVEEVKKETILGVVPEDKNAFFKNKKKKKKEGVKNDSR